MAATKLFSITSTEAKAIAYIVNPDKTDNGRLVYTFGCTANPTEASRMFQNIRDSGTGKTTILSHHMIQSFAPDEITPEQALEIGKLLCEKFLKNQYQYVLAVHTDTENIHLHCIFNNVNMTNFRSFEYLEDKGKVNERAWANLRNISDEICRANGLSVIENPEQSKGKSHYEWDMNRQGLSWKAKLKFAIDQVILENHALSDFARMGALSEELNTLHTQTEELSAKIKTARTYQKYKPIMDELKLLAGRKQLKFANAHADEITQYKKASKQLKEWFPDGSIPTPESMERKQEKLIQDCQSKHENYKAMKSQISELNYARQALDDYLRNERVLQEQKRKKGDLE